MGVTFEGHPWPSILIPIDRLHGRLI